MGSRPGIRMKTTIVCSLVLALLTTQVQSQCPEQGGICYAEDADALKDVNGDDILLNNGPLLNDLMTECKLLCDTAETDNPGALDCEYYTVKVAFGGEYKCYATPDCDPLVTDGFCYGADMCQSSRRDCAAEVLCSQLAALNPGEVPWVCSRQGGAVIDPYAADIPTLTECHQSCDAWDGILQSTCEDIAGTGTWSTVGDFPSASVTYPAPADWVEPDGPSQLSCTCGPLHIQWSDNPTDLVGNPLFYYDPNWVGYGAGTLTCETDPLDTSLGAGSFTNIIDPTNECLFFCDGYYAATVACVNGEWTGRPSQPDPANHLDDNLGLWCYKAPNSVDDDIN